MMERILLLERNGFPEKFGNVEVKPPEGISKQEFIEQKVIDAINEHNPKLKISKIEYDNLNSQFPDVYTSKFAGLIVEDKKIKESEKERFKKLGYHIRNINNEWFARKKLIYVFLTNPKEVSRNILVAQSIFPTLIDYMGKYIDSPSYTIANHPIYFINIINKKITALSVIKPLAGIIAAGIDYIEVFPLTINPKSVPKDVESFVRKYEENCKDFSSTFESNYYQVDFKLKKLKIKTTNLVIGDYLERNGEFLQFKGSSEKFYWMGILPIFLLACEDGYDIDFSELEKFYNANINNFKKNNEKFHRFKLLLDYMKKLTFK